MVKGFKFAVVAAILLCPFASPHSALARTFLSYQEAVWMCARATWRRATRCMRMRPALVGPKAAP
jgi:hypothetical protein